MAASEVCVPEPVVGAGSTELPRGWRDGKRKHQRTRIPITGAGTWFALPDVGMIARILYPPRKKPMQRSNTISDLTQRNVETIAQIETAIEDRQPLRERMAGALANTIGSWSFIVLQAAIVIAWTALNSLAGFAHWDPYPFGLLSLVLAIQVAFASPIILMSQNREAHLSDVRNHLNLQISLLSEQENTEMLKLLRALCEKADIDLKGHSETHKALEESIQPEQVLRQIADSDKSDKRIPLD
jgi:uncharacterized membrane protein